jgi:hypothetical protein
MIKVLFALVILLPLSIPADYSRVEDQADKKVKTDKPVLIETTENNIQTPEEKNNGESKTKPAGTRAGKPSTNYILYEDIKIERI